MNNQPPYQEDFFQRIVNVNWGGGTVFVFGDQSSTSVHYVKIKSAGAKPITRSVILPGPSINDLSMTCTGSSYATVNGVPTLLVAGNRTTFHMEDDGAGNMVKVIDFHLMIYRSNDGLNWSIARQQDFAGHFGVSRDEFGNACNLVWDIGQQTFYYNQNVTTAVTPTSDQIFSSHDGARWSMVSSAETGDDPAYRSSFTAHCTSNDCLDNRGQNVPDGVMCNDVKKQVTIKPVAPPITFYDSGTHSFDFASGDPSETWGSSEIKVTPLPASAIAPGFTMSIPGLKKVFCVAGYNGIYMAGGSPDLDGTTGAVALSVDGGKTWSMFATFPSAVTTMIAAPEKGALP